MRDLFKNLFEMSLGMIFFQILHFPEDTFLQDDKIGFYLQYPQGGTEPSLP